MMLTDAVIGYREQKNILTKMNGSLIDKWNI